MSSRFRLLPVLAAASALLFGAKIADLGLAIGFNPLPSARAQTAAPAQKAEANPAAKSEANAAATAPPPAKSAERDAAQFSPQEVQLLQSLAQRRDELDKRSGEVDQREALLQAAEKRINDKIAKLQEMEKAIDASFKKQDQQDQAKVESLVKIYETMKPQEAARIFEQLDLPVLLEVLERMKERKTAPILAAMAPAKAKAVTLALAERHPTPEIKQQ
jgi:flagellar motility protein MotE (MotC chaperone)